MTTAESIRVFLFLAIVVATYVAAIGVLTRAVGLRRLPSWKGRMVLALAGLGLLCMAYGYFIEPYWLSVSRVAISTSKLPAGAQPIRIAHISDIHSDAKPRLEEKLPAAIAQEKPDIIVFTGDSINSPAGLPVFKALFGRLSEIAPTFVVRGNWDLSVEGDLFGGTGVHELQGNAVPVDIRGVRIWLAGAAAGRNADVATALSTLPPEAFSIFLYHFPDAILEAAQHNVDLYCAGHTHGGQVALPLYGALITFSAFGKRYESGLFHEGHTSLYVNRGIGMEGGPTPRVRFWARPELTVFEVVPKE